MCIVLFMCICTHTGYGLRGLSTDMMICILYKLPSIFCLVKEDTGNDAINCVYIDVLFTVVINIYPRKLYRPTSPHTHAHTQTHLFLYIVGTFHRNNDFYHLICLIFDLRCN